MRRALPILLWPLGVAAEVAAFYVLFQGRGEVTPCAS